MITAVTTTFAGSLYANENTDSQLLYFLSGWVFSVPLMFILVVHEMGHYLAGRLRYLDVTPPYFIPAIPPLGTFGAFIKIRSPITNRRVLMEVGAWGPLAGAIPAIPLLYVGLGLSEVPDSINQNVIQFNLGSSIIVEVVHYLRFADFYFNSPIPWHPMASAAWFGLFVTAMNLLPIGQLDGGHVIYAMFGPRRARIISVVVLAALVPLGYFLWFGWFVFGALAMFLGLRHPPPLDPMTPLTPRERLLGWSAIILFVLTFIPVPITIIE